MCSYDLIINSTQRSNKMKNYLLLLFIAILTINSYSQIKFEKGYFVYDSDLKVECFIKNIDWSNNPTEFEYKLPDDSEEKIASINAVKEFGIYNVSKYIKSKVKIDRSSGNINDLTYDKSPVLKEENLFLKVLIEGKANLYSYEEGNFIRYFFNTETSNIEQLIFKKYKNHENDTKENNQFKQQLWRILKCEEITLDDIESLKYNRSSLIKLFTQYNTCANSNFINYTSGKKKDLFNLTLRSRLNNSKLSINESGVEEYVGVTIISDKHNEIRITLTEKLRRACTILRVQPTENQTDCEKLFIQTLAIT